LAVVGFVVAPAGAAVDFYNVATLDTGPNGLGTISPGSVAFNGTDLYLGHLFSSASVTRIGTPLTSPMVMGTFGGPAAGNGFVSLDVGSNYVVAASNNTGAADVVQTFDLNGNLLSQNTGGGLGFGRIDGAAADPGWVAGGGGGAGVSLTYFGGGRRNLYSPNDLTTLVDNSMIIFGPAPISNGWRDGNYDDATGNLFMRATQGITRYDRTGDHTFSGPQVVAVFDDGFNSAINVDFLPNWGGMNLAIANWRNAPAGNAFTDQVVVYDADQTQVPVVADFKMLDGTPFMAPDSDNGIYDFSYDAGTGLLAVSDHFNDKVYFFSPIPEPATMLVLLLGVGLMRRR
jgi:hypothetical protein